MRIKASVIHGNPLEKKEKRYESLMDIDCYYAIVGD